MRKNHKNLLYNTFRIRFPGV